ncbi:hypothetical protein B566_EDAN017776 [Ephemera danica]|nr:hypothetical protein B566_EDAN017776 [Ephemera danica]
MDICDRDYEPGTGRYVQRDPIGYFGGMNVYGYVGGSPLRHSDPYGLNPGTAVGAGIGTFIMPGLGTVVGAVLGTAIAIGIGWWAIESRASGEEKLPIENPGRDCDGNCKPCPPGKKWFVPKPGHGHENGYWHTIKYNQNPTTCECFPDRPSGGLDGF